MNTTNERYFERFDAHVEAMEHSKREPSRFVATTIILESLVEIVAFEIRVEDTIL